nr:ATP-binding cassette domain-containing protein [Clostridia bacterium]
LDLPAAQEMKREFDEDGRALSGGEAQRLAVARVFASDAPFAVLDEPSAALDPLAEAAMFGRLRAAGQNRTVLFISHRLSSVQACDRILVLDQGRLAEQGTHGTLVAQNGLYARMFRRQAEAYSGGTQP